MVRRLSVQTVLVTIILALAIGLVASISVLVWSSVQRMELADRLAWVADGSTDAFAAMHNLRTERATTLRALGDLATAPAAVLLRLDGLREAELPPLRRLVAVVERLPGQAPLDATLAELERLHAGTRAAMRLPPEARPVDLQVRYGAVSAELLERLGAISAALTETVRGADSRFDHLLSIRFLAWTLRNTAGEASLLVSNGIAAGRITGDEARAYAGHVASTQALWRALQGLVGENPPPEVAAAMAKVGSELFDPAFVSLRDRLLQTLLVGARPEMDANTWAPLTVARLASLLAVGEAALDAARGHAAAEHARARQELLVQTVLLVAALLVGCGAALAVGSRVVRPLRRISDAMTRLAGGDLSADAAVPPSTDEIGSLARSFEAFRDSARAKTQSERAEAERRLAAEARSRRLEERIVAFEANTRSALDSLARAQGEMAATSGSLGVTAQRSRSGIDAAAAASQAATGSVETVAHASDQLAQSIREISNQMNRAGQIVGTAVEQTRSTDATVQGLAEAAGRIGEVVRLISDIAGQTNLLALNATIEAARAGEAGKGFAVVASEVKSLAAQTARATDEISGQINAIRRVTGDAVEAIQKIGGTISEVALVATAIASAVEEQGVATQEITRRTQDAAEQTRLASGSLEGAVAGLAGSREAAEGVARATDEVGAQAAVLRERVSEFLAGIRSA